MNILLFIVLVLFIGKSILDIPIIVIGMVPICIVLYIYLHINFYKCFDLGFLT